MFESMLFLKNWKKKQKKQVTIWYCTCYCERNHTLLQTQIFMLSIFLLLFSDIFIGKSSFECRTQCKKYFKLSL